MELYEWEREGWTVTFCLPLPSHRLTKNEATKATSQQAAKGIWATARNHRGWAKNVATSFVNSLPPRGEYEASCPPFYSDGTEVEVYLRCERAKRGQVWDSGGMIEAMKSYIDGFEGLLFANDKAVVYWAPIEWDDKPTRGTGAGRVYVTFKPRSPELERGKYVAITDNQASRISLNLHWALNEMVLAEDSSVDGALRSRRAEAVSRLVDTIDLLADMGVIESGGTDRGADSEAGAGAVGQGARPDDASRVAGDEGPAVPQPKPRTRRSKRAAGTGRLGGGDEPGQGA